MHFCICKPNVSIEREGRTRCLAEVPRVFNLMFKKSFCGFFKMRCLHQGKERRVAYKGQHFLSIFFESLFFFWSDPQEKWPCLPVACSVAAPSYGNFSFFPRLGHIWVLLNCLSAECGPAALAWPSGTLVAWPWLSGLLWAQCSPAWFPWRLRSHPALCILAICPIWRTLSAIVA